MASKRGLLTAPITLATVIACSRPVYYLQAPLERATADGGTTSSAVDRNRRRDAGPVDIRTPATIAGRWAGTGVQSDGQRWQLIVTFKATVQGICAIAEYPGVGCTAEWTCHGIEEGGQVSATERLTRGKDKCIDGGEMLMDFQGSELEWSWRKDGQSADATLRRMP